MQKKMPMFVGRLANKKGTLARPSLLNVILSEERLPEGQSCAVEGPLSPRYCDRPRWEFPPILVSHNRLRPQNTSLPADAPPAPTLTVRVPAKIPKSTALPHSPPVSAVRITSSDLPDSGRPDNQTNTSIPDISDGTNRESPVHLHLQSPTLRAFFCDAVPPTLPLSPR